MNRNADFLEMKLLEIDPQRKKFRFNYRLKNGGSDVLSGLGL